MVICFFHLLLFLSLCVGGSEDHQDRGGGTDSADGRELRSQTQFGVGYRLTSVHWLSNGVQSKLSLV